MCCWVRQGLDTVLSAIYLGGWFQYINGPCIIHLWQTESLPGEFSTEAKRASKISWLDSDVHLFLMCLHLKRMMTCPWNKMSTFIYVSIEGRKSAIHLLFSTPLFPFLDWAEPCPRGLCLNYGRTSRGPLWKPWVSCLCSPFNHIMCPSKINHTVTLPFNITCWHQSSVATVVQKIFPFPIWTSLTAKAYVFLFKRKSRGTCFCWPHEWASPASNWG